MRRSRASAPRGVRRSKDVVTNEWIGEGKNGVTWSRGLCLVATCLLLERLVAHVVARVSDRMTLVVLMYVLLGPLWPHGGSPMTTSL